MLSTALRCSILVAGVMGVACGNTDSNAPESGRPTTQDSSEGTGGAKSGSGGAAGGANAEENPIERNNRLATLDVSDAPDRPICDGSDRFTFERVTYDSQLEGSAFGLLWRNGFASLRVDGHCRYFAYQSGRNDLIATGTLTSEQAERLAQEVMYAGWPLLDGLSANGASTHSLELLNDGEHTLVCRHGCRSGAAPEDANAVARLAPWFDAADRWHDEAIAEGVPLESDVWIAVEFEEDIVHSGKWFEWPLSTPIESYLPDGPQTDEEGAGSIRPVLLSGDDARAMRELRAAAFRERTVGAITEGWIAIDAPGDLFHEVVVAEALPYEDAEGRVPRPD